VGGASGVSNLHLGKFSKISNFKRVNIVIVSGVGSFFVNYNEADKLRKRLTKVFLRFRSFVHETIYNVSIKPA